MKEPGASRKNPLKLLSAPLIMSLAIYLNELNFVIKKYETSEYSR
jgi:hypothetical protein